MLPEALSNGLCSLVPGEDRACLAVEIEIGPDGSKRKHRFLRGLMNSHARLTYDAVEDYRTGADTEPPAGLDAAILDNLYAAYALLAERRKSRGALELDLPEKRVRFDDAGNAVAITRKRQSVSQKLIEEFMILANVCAAETLEGANMLCVFRAHERPDGDKLDGLQDMVRQMGLSFPKGQVVSPNISTACLPMRPKKEMPLILPCLTRLCCAASHRRIIASPIPGISGWPYVVMHILPPRSGVTPI